MKQSLFVIALQRISQFVSVIFIILALFLLVKGLQYLFTGQFGLLISVVIGLVICGHCGLRNLRNPRRSGILYTRCNDYSDNYS